MIDESEQEKWGAHVDRGGWILDDLNLTRFHEDTIARWTREVRDPFDRAIILSDGFRKFNANPFAYSERGRAAEANNTTTERDVNNRADGDVDGG